jgi:cell division GTPase FtsZ
VKLGLLGLGQAGGKIVDRFLEYDAETPGEMTGVALAINSARTDLEGLEYVPADCHILVGQSEVRGHGVGGDNDLGARVMENDLVEVQRMIDDNPIPDLDAFLVVAALGGGTGSGGSPVLATHLDGIYSQPVYGLGVLPGEEEGSIYTLNAARSFQSLIGAVDNLLLFDNEAWRTAGASVAQGFDAINEELVRRFGVLFRAGELVEEGNAVAESVVDASEITNTLASGGVSTVGYASTPVEQRGLLDRLRRDGKNGTDEQPAKVVTDLVEQATRGRLTLPGNVGGAERALCVIAGPPHYLSRKGIERSRRWLERQTESMEVRGGDYPIPGADHVAAAVLFSGLSDVERLRHLQQTATEAQDRIESRRAEADDVVDELLEEGDELDPLY